jgi:ring-1,2-phenylacetyl-CoA epoxidase subunit PaaE
MGMVRVHVTAYDGEVHVLESVDDALLSITDMAEAQGIDLPYSCRSGACFTCCAEVTQWQEWLEQNKTWEQLIDVEPQEFLTCIGGIAPQAYQGDEDREIHLTMLN